MHYTKICKTTMMILKRYSKYLYCSIKMGLAFLYVRLNKSLLYSKEIWLIQEKHTEARDNGYFLFRYIRENHPEINAFYSITDDSPDRFKVDVLGNTISADSFMHYVYYLAAKYSIGSQPFGACPYPTDWNKKLGCFRRRDQKVVFLQHGVIKDNLPGLNYKKTHFDLFICSAVPEHLYVCNELNYPSEKVGLLGLCRFDNLNNRKKNKSILIMPTFRKWLVAKDRENDADKSDCERFKNSSFYKYYSNLLSNTMLLHEAMQEGYKIYFYLHYSFQSFTKEFLEYANDTVIIADRFHYDVQQLLIDNSILITDYSSVFFDFAYMLKPEVYFQFDESEYRENHYYNGYFDYRKDGFGPVYSEIGEVVDYVIKKMKSDCQMEEKYRKRANDFFAYRDNKNCERTFNAIEKL